MTLLENRTVLLIGTGPTRIGQWAECDEGAAESASALKEATWRFVYLTDGGRTIFRRRWLWPLGRDYLQMPAKTISLVDCWLPAAS